MVKLFRRHRIDLIEGQGSIDNTTNRSGLKYFKYAMGEIILVVIGILIALSINNWNENRKEKNLKNTYAARLVNDLNKDLETIQAKIARIEKMTSAITQFVNSLDSKAEMADKIIITETYFTEGWSTVSFAAQKNTFTDLSQTGNMKVFKDTDLREEILTYYSLIDNYTNGYEINKDWVVPIDVVISQETDALGFSAKTKDLYNLQDKESAIHDFVNQKDLLKRHASVHYWINFESLKTMREMQQAAKKLIKSLENA